MSQKFSLNEVDWKKIGVGALVALGGALLTYSQEVFTTIDFGAYQGIAVAVNSVIVNVVRKYLAGA